MLAGIGSQLIHGHFIQRGASTLVDNLRHGTSLNQRRSILVLDVPEFADGTTKEAGRGFSFDLYLHGEIRRASRPRAPWSVWVWAYAGGLADGTRSGRSTHWAVTKMLPLSFPVGVIVARTYCLMPV